MFSVPPWVISSESRERSRETRLRHATQVKGDQKSRANQSPQQRRQKPEDDFISVNESLVFPVESGTPPGLEPLGEGRVWADGMKTATPCSALPTNPPCVPFYAPVTSP